MVFDTVCICMRPRKTIIATHAYAEIIHRNSATIRAERERVIKRERFNKGIGSDLGKNVALSFSQVGDDGKSLLRRPRVIDNAKSVCLYVAFVVVIRL